MMTIYEALMLMLTSDLVIIAIFSEIFNHKK